MQEETLALLRETRATSMIVTHHPEEALRLGDRIAVMRAGRLVQAGKAEELYRSPADLFVARLFSAINEIPFTVHGGAIDTPIGRLAAAGIGEGGQAILCIRERAVRLGEPGTGLPGRILRVKPLGDIGLVEIGVQGFEQPLRMRVREMEVPARGSDVGVEVDMARVLVFAP